MNIKAALGLLMIALFAVVIAIPINLTVSALATNKLINQAIQNAENHQPASIEDIAFTTFVVHNQTQVGRVQHALLQVATKAVNAQLALESKEVQALAAQKFGNVSFSADAIPNIEFSVMREGNTVHLSKEVLAILYAHFTAKILAL